jgi:site-specific DNA-cytosine methylase
MPTFASQKFTQWKPRRLNGSGGNSLAAAAALTLARFQSFPDWYELPERNALACKIIGNAVPPLLMRRVMEAQCSSF